MSLGTFISWQDLPYIAIIMVGIFIPELYLRMSLSFRLLVTLRLVTMLIVCILSTVVSLWLRPGSDPGVVFTRSFIFIGVCRVIILSSRQTAQHKEVKTVE